MKVTLALILAQGFPVPTPFVVGYSGLLQMLLTGEGNAVMPCTACGLKEPPVFGFDRTLGWICRICKMSNARAIDASRVIFEHNFPVDFARNHACTAFLDHDDGDYLLFLDADMKHPPDLAHRLVGHGLDIVTARYVQRRAPFFSIAMRKVGEGPTDYSAMEKVETNVTGLMPIDAGGAGCLLIARPVLEAIRARIGDDWFRYQDGPDGNRSRSEDMWFYEQAKAAGFQAYLDADLVCKHIGQFELDPEWHQPFQATFRAALAEARAKAAAHEGVTA